MLSTLAERLFLSGRYVLYTLRGGFLVRPLIIALALGSVGAVLSGLEEVFPRISSVVPTTLFPSRSDAQVAQVVLSTIATSMMTVVSIVFAILLMTLTLASMQFSPRIVVSFARDRLTQQTLGIFLGTFSYCVAALPAARMVPHPFAPVLTVAGAMVLAAACVGWLLVFIHHISQAISVNHIVDRIATETLYVIDEMMPEPRRLHRLPEADPPVADREEIVVGAVSSGYIRFVDVRRLVVLARSYGVRVIVLRRVGQFVSSGVPLMSISRGSRLSGPRRNEFLAAFNFGPTRTLQQDVEFGVLQIVDIALKAISPAVNDPSTAINCIDQLSRIVIHFASRDEAPGRLYDPPGVLRVSLAWPDFGRLMDAAFDQIRLYARGDVAVSLRLLRALTDIAAALADPTLRADLVERGQRIVTGCADRLEARELGMLRDRMSGLEKVASNPRGAQD